MASLKGVHHKLDTLSEKLDAANPHHEELHFEAVVEITTALKEVVEDAVNTLLYGISYAFEDEDVFAYTDVHVNAVEPGTKVPIHRHMNTSETVVCIRGHFEEYFYDDNSNLTETIDMHPGSVVLNIEKGQ